MEKYLLEDESVISRSPDDEVVLTTLRIRYSTNGGKDVVSLMLDSVCAIRTHYESSPWLAVAGVACLLGATFMGIAEIQIPFIILSVIAGFVCLISYWGSRHYVITISSAAASILFQVNKMTTDGVLEFINQVEDARAQFLRSMHYGVQVSKAD